MQFNHSASWKTNMDCQDKQLQHHSDIKSKVQNGFNGQTTHLEETIRKQVHTTGGNFLTQEIFTTAKKKINNSSHAPSDLCENTAQPTDLFQQKKKKRVSTASHQESGYLGEIRFESRNGVKREFHMFADKEIGIKQNTQAVLIEQGWDEDIETDESCKRKAIKKCMKQLSIAIRHQREGIDPTSAYEQDYQDVEERFAHENNQIQQDYHNNQYHKQSEKKQGNQQLLHNYDNNSNSRLSQHPENGIIGIQNSYSKYQNEVITLEGIENPEVIQQQTQENTCNYPAQYPLNNRQMTLGLGCGSQLQNDNLSSQRDLHSQQQHVDQNPIEMETQLDLPICASSQVLRFSQEIDSFRIQQSRLLEESNEQQDIFDCYSSAEIAPSPDSFFLEKLQQQQLTQGTNHSAYRFCPDFPSISFSL